MNIPASVVSTDDYILTINWLLISGILFFLFYFINHYAKHINGFLLLIRQYSYQAVN